MKEITQKAREAQKSWQEMPVKSRINLLKKFQKLINQNIDSITEAICKETFKPKIEAIGIEIAAVQMTISYYSKIASGALKKRRAAPHWLFLNKYTLIEQLPYGVVGIIGPANLPFVLTIGDAIPALLAGNAVVIKPSEVAPSVTILAVNLMREAGLPENLIQFVEGDGNKAKELIDHVDFVFFTGSNHVGKLVAVQCAQLFKPCVLELGGKSPMIVFEDADLKRAAKAAIWGRFANAGQHCVATEKVYVSQLVEKRFLEILKDQMQKLKGECLGKVYVPNVAARLESQLKDALEKGASILFEGEADQKGFFILSGVTSKMDVAKLESFGPLLPIINFRHIEELVEELNGESNGLSAAIFTQDYPLALSVARELEVGNVTINDVMSSFGVMDAPFAGWKESGGGLRHSPAGLLQFCRPQTYTIQRFNWPLFKSADPWWFPYTSGWYAIIKRLIKFL